MKGHAVLLVDDDEMVVKLLESTFAKSTYRVLTANNGPQALALMEHQSVSLIISDNKMPEMSGIEVFSEVRRRWPDCGRVLLTGYAEVEDTISAINDGWVHRFITKPWAPDQLLQTVDEMVG